MSIKRQRQTLSSCVVSYLQALFSDKVREQKLLTKGRFLDKSQAGSDKWMNRQTKGRYYSMRHIDKRKYNKTSRQTRRETTLNAAVRN